MKKQIILAVLAMAMLAMFCRAQFTTNSPSPIAIGTIPQPVTTISNNFYQNIGQGWSNIIGHNSRFRIPFSFTNTATGGGWGVQVFITNYYGQVGVSNTITNVDAFTIGQAGIAAQAGLGGSNFVDGNVTSNGSIWVGGTVGTVTLLNLTNNQSQISY